MRVEVKPTSADPGFQFIVRADTDSDRVIIDQMLRLSGKKDLQFALLGITHSNGGGDSFNFGWYKLEPKKRRKSKSTTKRKT